MFHGGICEVWSSKNSYMKPCCPNREVPLSWVESVPCDVVMCVCRSSKKGLFVCLPLETRYTSLENAGSSFRTCEHASEGRKPVKVRFGTLMVVHAGCGRMSGAEKK